MRRQGRRAMVGLAMLVVGLVASAGLEGEGSGAMALFEGFGGEGARMVTVPADAAD
jgi:hypothetical protein